MIALTGNFTANPLEILRTTLQPVIERYDYIIIDCPPSLGTVTMKGKDWKPYQKADFVTPPFAEFVSGHSTFSAAGAYILRAFTGRDFYGGSVIISKLDIDNKDILPDVELRWPTFSNAAQQAGMSRLYGGIHFMEGNLHGQAIGEKVGQCTWEKAAALWEGSY